MGVSLFREAKARQSEYGIFNRSKTGLFCTWLNNALLYPPLVTLIFAGTLSGELLYWKVNPEYETLEITPKRILVYEDSVFSVQCLPKIKSVISASRDKSVKLWSLKPVDCVVTPARAQREFRAHKLGT
jgi:WD40 repeat protein